MYTIDLHEIAKTYSNKSLDYLCHVPISCYQCDSVGGWTWWRAGDAVRDCVITRADLDGEEA